MSKTTYTAVSANSDRFRKLTKVVWISTLNRAFPCPWEALGPCTARAEGVAGQIYRLADGVARHLAQF